MWKRRATNLEVQLDHNEIEVYQVVKNTIEKPL